jgi:hypothetical protein
MTPKKPYWFELSEGDNSSSSIRKINRVLPITTLAVAGVLMLGGSIFVNTNNEALTVSASGNAAQISPNPQSSTQIMANEISPTLATAKQNSSLASLPMPVVTKVAQGDDEDDEDEGDND